MPQRLALINNWLQNDLRIDHYTIEPASSDASFRRYFRVTSERGHFDDYGAAQSLIVMDAPPSHENVKPFIYVSGLMAGIGLNVPVVLEKNIEDGILLLTDLGNVQYLGVLSEDNVEELYADAMRALFELQTRGPKQSDVFQAYDRAFFQRELNIFTEWYLEKHIGLGLSDAQRNILEECHQILIESALQQPIVLVHRDFHSRNLMVTQRHNPGILDFQDAVIGPVTYDLVSLLRDCYIAWSPEKVTSWCIQYKKRIEQAGIISSVSDETFMRWVDLMGMQRHLKAIGIFARLNHRDSKPHYLNDIPRTMAYVLNVAGRYEELKPMHELLLSIGS